MPTEPLSSDFRDLLDERFDAVRATHRVHSEKLDQILAQVSATNGRIQTAEKDIVRLQAGASVVGVGLAALMVETIRRVMRG